MEGKALNPTHRQEKDSWGVPGLWWSFLSLALVLSLPGLSYGARSGPLYISDSTVEANLWNGTKVDHRIIAMLRPGTPVTLLREDEGWAEVALQDGRRGWILQRYLSDRPSWMATAQRLEAENQKLREQVKGFGNSQHETAQENDRLKRDLEGTRQKLAQMQTTFDDAKFSGRMRWFLSGAAVVLVGWILGFWTGRARRRRSSDLYR
jgi:SH3 domain protein